SEPDVSYTYDLVGNLTGASQTGNALTFGYDALGRNTSQGGPQGTMSYQYDAAGRRTRLTWPDSFYVTYDYQVTGEVTTIKESGSTTLATYAYDDLGRRTSLTRGNGNVTSYGFDNVSRLASIGLNLDGATTTNDVTTSFIYSPASQIAGQTRTNDLYAWGGHFNVNRGYTSNGLNQLTAAGGTSLDYDARGNLTSSGSDSFGYSSENLLTSATVASVSTTLSYDPALRLYQTAAGTTTRFQYDGADLIAEYNSSNELQKRYVHGSGVDETLVEYDSSGNRTYLLADAWLDRSTGG
ncbi:MAG: RHS repeat protein, partial [Sphingomonas sp.]|nr:RHS repeat protein [Sphingomonas sp.]